MIEVKKPDLRLTPTVEELPDSVIEATASAIGDAYDCMRVWSAWDVGTMGQDDFYLVSEDTSRVAEIAIAAITAFLAAKEAP